MYYVYILQSAKSHGFYVGSSQDVEARLHLHNNGKVRSTKKAVPWTVVHYEVYKTRQEAYQRELQIKSYKGGEAFKRLIEQQ